jgi:hypothetical protein
MPKELSAKRKAYQKAYQKAYKKAYHQTAKWKAYQKAYHQTAKYKAYMKAYHQTAKWKAYKKAYNKKNKCMLTQDPPKGKHTRYCSSCGQPAGEIQHFGGENELEACWWCLEIASACISCFIKAEKNK